MKKTLLLLSLIFGLQNASSQCTESTINFGNNTGVPMYNISGDVSVTLNADNTITLNLASNFMTAAGPDIRAFLVKSNGASNATLSNTLISNLENLEFGLVGSTSSGLNQNGAKSFTIPVPSSASIETFDRIFFYCNQFNQFWDLGSFTPFTSSTCALLSINEKTLDQTVSLYPNPAREQFEIRNDKQIALSITLYDILGNKLQTLAKSELKKQSISLSNLNSGVYLVQIKNGDQQIIKKLIKR